MVIQTTPESMQAFIKLYTEVIGGFQYSINNTNKTISLDETIGGIYTAQGKIPASRIIDVIGEEAFKSFIENTAKFGRLEDFLRTVGSLSSILYHSFDWSESIEGNDYWRAIYFLLKAVRV